MSNSTERQLSPKQREELLKVLKSRFEKNMNRHKDLEWEKVLAKLQGNPEKLIAQKSADLGSSKP